MKEVTRERLERAFAAVDRYSDLLTGRDRRIVSSMAQYGFRSMIADATGTRDPLFADKVTLELALEEAHPLDYDQVFDRWKMNIEKVWRRKELIQSIQAHHEISSLTMEELRVGEGVISYWEPRDDDFVITDGDLELLKGDRDHLFQFWCDHVELNGLTVFADVEDEWEPTTVEDIRFKLCLFGWVKIWEHIFYLKPDLSSPVTNLSGEVVGYAYKTSSSPKEGYKKHHELHLGLGSGKNWDGAESSTWFCATNGDRPFN